MVPGFYKWKEKKIFIKEAFKSDFSLLLVELLHSKSITQGNSYIKPWISEGLPHFLAKVLCNKCNIDYSDSGHQIYFSIWAQLYNLHGITKLRDILYVDDINVSIGKLKQIFRYNYNDILEISFEKAKDLLKFIY